MHFDVALAIVLLLAAQCVASDATRASATSERRAAVAAAQAGKLDEAIRLATKAIEIAPTDPDVYQLRASLFATQGDHQRAVDDYDQLLKLAPERADVYDQRGSQHFMLGDVDASIE